MKSSFYFGVFGLTAGFIYALGVMPQSALAADAAAGGTAGTLVVEVGANDKRVSPSFFGLMTEEINHSYDGGLYAEMLRNRSFADDAKGPVHWEVVGGERPEQATISLDASEPVNSALPMSLKFEAVKVDGNSGQRVGIANGGYWGIAVGPGTAYRASFFARASEASTGPLLVSLQSEKGDVTYAKAVVDQISNKWQRYTVTLTTGKDIAASKNNRFVISTGKPGTYWFSQVSLMPPTWHDRPNGCRADLMQLMADLKPTFLRCPGGNYLEGDSVESRFAWKTTLGDISQRPGHMGTWTYRSSDGMGLLEFLEWAEDIGAEPVLAVYAGFSLPSKDHPGGTSVPVGDELKPFVTEAIEEIEYATGDVKTTCGARRAADGHPAPFKLHYVEIGNEDFLDKARKSYEGRFAQFYDAIHAAYPELKMIATIPVKGRTADAVDDHYYKTSDEMARLAHRYDKTDRKGPKVFVGEWATREIAKDDGKGNTKFVMMPWSYRGGPTPTLHAALGDAAFMTGLERNADVVVMNCYAPMLTRVEPGAFQWCPNMIGYDAQSSFASPSYYVQQMFNRNLGDTILSTPSSMEQKDCFYSATRSSKSGMIHLKVVNRSSVPQTLHISLKGIQSVSPDGQAICLTATDPMSVNSIEQPKKIAPESTPVHGLATQFDYTFAGNSLTVINLQGR